MLTSFRQVIVASTPRRRETSLSRSQHVQRMELDSDQSNAKKVRHERPKRLFFPSAGLHILRASHRLVHLSLAHGHSVICFLKRNFAAPGAKRHELVRLVAQLPARTIGNHCTNRARAAPFRSGRDCSTRSETDARLIRSRPWQQNTLNSALLNKAPLIVIEDKAGQAAGRISTGINIDPIGTDVRFNDRRMAVNHYFLVSLFVQ
jgi:hypothetical protein